MILEVVKLTHKPEARAFLLIVGTILPARPELRSFSTKPRLEEDLMPDFELFLEPLVLEVQVRCIGGRFDRREDQSGRLVLPAVMKSAVLWLPSTTPCGAYFNLKPSPVLGLETEWLSPDHILYTSSDVAELYQV